MKYLINAIYKWFKAAYEASNLGKLREDDFNHPWKVFGYDSYTGTYLVDIQRTNPYVDDGCVAKGNVVVYLTSGELQLHEDYYYSKDFRSNCI